MRSRAIILFSIVLGTMLALVILLSWPTNTSLSILNNSDEGFSVLYNQFKPLIVLGETDIFSVPPTNTLLLVATKKPLNDSTVQILIEFARRGGIIVVSTEAETAIHLLRNAPTNCTPTPHRVYNPLFNVGGNKRLVKALVPDIGSTIVLESPFRFLNCSISETYALSGMFSYVDLNGNGFYDIGEEVVNTVLGVSIVVEEGKIVILASPTAFTNRYIAYNQGILIRYTEMGFKIAILQSTEIMGFNIEFIRIYLMKIGLAPMLPYLIALTISGVVVYVWRQGYME